jgi:dihydrodipicolinate synthase/N-acetylneuraminate lyase
MSHELWSGIFPASLTMFNADGSVDLAGTAAHVSYLVDGGAHGVVIGGTTGEFITMTDAERIAVIGAAVEAAAGRVPVIAGTGAASTAQTIALTKSAADRGAAGALVILPYYMKPFRAEVLGHYRAVAAAATIPVLLYNNPGNSGADALDATDIGMLYAEGVLQGVKNTFPTVHQIVETIDETGPDFRSFCGGFNAPLAAFAEGAHGWISGILNVVLPEALVLWDAVKKADLGGARSASTVIRKYRYLYSRQPLGPINDMALYRQILTLRGQHGGYCRPPLRELDPGRVPELERLLTGITG